MTLFLIGGRRSNPQRDPVGTPMVSIGHGILHTASPSQRHTGLRDAFSFRAILPWGFIFSEMGPLVLPHLTITIVFYDLHRCSGSILSSPITQGNKSWNNSCCKIKDSKGRKCNLSLAGKYSISMKKYMEFFHATTFH